MEVHDRHTLVRFFSEMPEVETALVSELMVTLAVIHLDQHTLILLITGSLFRDLNKTLRNTACVKRDKSSISTEEIAIYFNGTLRNTAYVKSQVKY